MSDFIASTRRALHACTILGVATIAACGGTTTPDHASPDHRNAAATSARVVACTLMPREEINAITGGNYTSAESNDDGHSSESACHYSTAADPAGIAFNLEWVSPRDYSNPAEHAALQRAMIGGAKLGGSLASQTIGGASIPGLPTGPIEGVGEEATLSMLLLTARKGDYSVMVQIFPTDMMKLMTDSTVALALLEQEKTIARAALAKL
jgi:hypothetical protein